MTLESEESEEATSRPAKMIPFRMQQVLISWIFIVASAGLLLDFLSLQVLLRNPPMNPGYFAELCDWFGVLNCVLWLLGFIILVHWLQSVGATRLAILAALLKVVASALFNIQPMTGTMNDPSLSGGVSRGGGAGTWWSNAAGITFFHCGNVLSCLDFRLHPPPGSSKTESWLYHGNLPITGMWLYQLSTWALVGANYLSAGPNGDPTASLMPTTSTTVYTLQVVGAVGLLIGSVVYGIWCDAFTDFSH